MSLARYVLGRTAGLPRTLGRSGVPSGACAPTSIRTSGNLPSLVVSGSRTYTNTTHRPVTITYVEPDGSEKTVDAKVGQHLLDVAHEHGVELEGACGGELACSTCHLIFEPAVYDTLPPKSDEEEDMLDLAFEVTETSRLGCQIIVREDMDGIKVRIPDDGF